MRKILAAAAALLILILAAPAVPTAGESQIMSEPPAVRSGAAVLIDADSGQVLYQKNMDERMYPASITKVAAALVALQKGDLGAVITMSHDAVFSIDRDSSHIALDVGEQITLEQALYAMSLESANDAANGVAELIGGSLDNFAIMMNKAAAAVGAAGTHFANAHGLPDENHYTTAHDMALIMAEALRTPGFAEIFGSKHYEIPPTNKQPETRVFSSRNKLVNGEIACEGVLAGKTGWTSQAQSTLVTAARRNGVTLIVVVMQSVASSDKWDDTVALFDYGFSQFTSQTLSRESLTRSNVTLAVGEEGHVTADFYAEDDVSVLLPAGKSLTDVSISYDEPQISSSGEVATLLAHLTLSGAESELGQVVLTAQIFQPSETTVTDPSVTPGGHKTSRWLILVPLVILALAVGAALKMRQLERRRRQRRANRPGLRH